MEPEQTTRHLKAFETAFTRRLNDLPEPLQIHDGDKIYNVTGVDDGYFRVQQVDQRGNDIAGVTQLPCTEQYIGLVLDAWIATGTNLATSAAGGGSRL